MEQNNRVVVTGMGAVTALGHTLDETFDRLCAGVSGIREVPSLKQAGFPVYIGGTVPDLDTLLDRYPDARRHHSRKLAFACKALDDALGSARLTTLAGLSCGLYLGVETGRVAFENTYRIFHFAGRATNRVDYREFGLRRRDLVPAAQIQNKMPCFLGRYLAVRHGISGPMLATSNACASSNYAIGEALRKLRSGRIQVAIAGSADEMIDEYMITGFSLLKALSPNNARPEGASRPFDTRRDGFVLGEGAAMLVLETLDHACRRGAPIVCELAGFGATSDGEKITACQREGVWLLEAMRRALADAGMDRDEVDYVNAHGTSTRLNDTAEVRAIASLFGDRSSRVLVNSTKSMIGHTVAAAGAIEAAVTIRSIVTGVCHPTLNLENLDPGCGLNCCPGRAVRSDLGAALSNSCGFSGANSCLAFRKYEGRP
ncbi:MAG: beta-ketoacyl-[acyl-carrier-protein] synthase family protein [Candidatus Riflebacteria bacterium]|nr:beta-ketoacyl-[acyl-carrier-protein] synthase family protein [Candidatus Riflebacteria bacterium]